MSVIDNKQAIKAVRQRNFLARDFDGFRTVLLDYARRYYPDKIQDFSEASLGGLFLDMAAYVGDNLSFYLDHLYGELNFDTVVETRNIEQAVRNAGIEITGASPALVAVDFYIEVPVISSANPAPDPTLLPTIESNTILKANNGTKFTLVEDVNFWQKNPDTNAIELNENVVVTNGKRVNGNLITKILKLSGICSSGVQTTETFKMGEFVPFRRLTLSNTNITDIISVTDDKNNIYYEVENLTHDVVYKNIINVNSSDKSLVKDSLTVIPAPFRFIKQTSLSDRTVTLVMGGGTADTLEDDSIPDPSDFAIPLLYSQTFSRKSVNPQSLLQTTTLGVSSANSTLTVVYRHGGGLSHNVSPGSIKTIVSTTLNFPENPPFNLQVQIRNGLEVYNEKQASGGEDAPSQQELLSLVPSIKSSQERIVTKEDLLARVYTMPSNFGRVFRASVNNNPNNPLASQLFVISRSADGKLITSTDTLKINLKKYLNSYRMISDSIDILDAEVINLEIFFQVIVDPRYNKITTLKTIIQSLQAQFNIKNFNINQPIIKSDIVSTIYAQDGVVGIDSVIVKNLFGNVKNRQYSNSVFDVKANTRNQIIYPPRGGIFEVRFPEVNITGKAISNV